MLLMAYNYDIRYVPGKDIGSVEALSRMLVTSSENEDDDFEELSVGINCVSDQLGVLLAEIASETSVDTFLTSIMDRIINNKWWCVWSRNSL